MVLNYGKTTKVIKMILNRKNKIYKFEMVEKCFSTIATDSLIFASKDAVLKYFKMTQNAELINPMLITIYEMELHRKSNSYQVIAICRDGKNFEPIQ